MITKFPSFPEVTRVPNLGDWIMSITVVNEMTNDPLELYTQYLVIENLGFHRHSQTWRFRLLDINTHKRTTWTCYGDFGGKLQTQTQHVKWFLLGEV